MATLEIGAAELRLLTRLSDELREFPFGEPGVGAGHLLDAVSAILGAANAYWVVAVRDGKRTGSGAVRGALGAPHPCRAAETSGGRRPSASMIGWSIAHYAFLRPAESLLASADEAAARLAAGDPDRMTACYTRAIGQTRAARPVDLMTRREWEEDWYVRDHLAKAGWGDLVQGSVIVDSRAELTFGFQAEGSRRFGKRQRDTLLVASALLRQPVREMVVAGGWLGPDGSLSRRELEVLDRLLQGMSEPEIAEDLRIAANTVHHHASSVYRKLGVRGRTGLLSLWVGRRSRSSSPGA